jgi:hypothetical protein
VHSGHIDTHLSTAASAKRACGSAIAIACGTSMSIVYRLTDGPAAGYSASGLC